MDNEPMIERYGTQDRITHWVTAILFVLMALSGLALFHPAFFFLTNFFGGGSWTRILHPFMGVLTLLSFLLLAARFGRDNRITEADRQWGKHLGEFIRNREDNLPEIGKYNLGQKYLFWTLVVTILLLFASGMVIWQPYFAPAFSIGVIRIAVVVHALAAFVAIAAIIIHIYAALWVKGSIRAMTRGKVTPAWARQHHATWYREIRKEAK